MKKFLSLFMALIFLYLPTHMPYSNGAESNAVQLPPVVVDPETANFIRTGDWENAIEGLRRAWQRHDADPNLTLYLAEGYKTLAIEAFRENRFEEALHLFDEALAVRDQDAELHTARGMCFFRMSEYFDARQAFEQALHLDPNSFSAHLKLGEVYYLINEPYLAAISWEHALRLDPENQNLKKRLDGLYHQMDRDEQYEVEADRYFSVTFDGEKNPRLRGKVLDILWDAHYEVGHALLIYPKRQIAVTLLARSDFHEITHLPSWVSGLYEGQIKIPVAGYDENILRENLYHEYVHAVIFDMMSQRCPWWLNEGLAQFFSPNPAEKTLKKNIARQILEQNPAPSLMSLRTALDDDPARARTAYALALSAVDFFIEEFNFFNLQNLLELLSEGMSIENAMPETTGFSLEQFQHLWSDTITGR